MFLSTGVSGSLAPTGGTPEYDTSRDGGTEFTVYEGVQSGEGAYEGPSLAYTRPLTADYNPQATIAPVNTVAPEVMPQGPNPYADGPVNITTAMPTTSTTADCGCKGKFPWYILAGIVAIVVLFLKD